VERKPGQVREGLSYVRQDRVLALTVTAMSVVFVAAYNFQVLVPLLTFRMLGGSSELYGVVMSCLGLGAVTGSLLIASWVKPGVMMIAAWCGLLSIVHNLAGSAGGGLFRACGHVLAGRVLRFFQRYRRQHPAGQGA
jgi:hypothetical protein